jgi:cytochrome c biogenesis factor
MWTKSLTNGLLLIHPVILYLSLSLLFFLIFNSLNKRNIKTHNTLNIFIFNKNIFLFIFVFLFTSIFLGSWWAEQEINWGGW